MHTKGDFIKKSATNPSYSRRWRRRRADFPLMVGFAVARCVCFAAASGLGVGAGGSRGWIAGAMVAPSFMALSASTPPRCGGSTRPLPAHAIVLSVHEKSQIQALDRH